MEAGASGPSAGIQLKWRNLTRRFVFIHRLHFASFCCFRVSHVSPGSLAWIVLSFNRGFSRPSVRWSVSKEPLYGRSSVADARIGVAARAAAAARAPAALSRSAAAGARLLHGGSLVWSSLTQQLASCPQFLSVLGRIISKCSPGLFLFSVCMQGCATVYSTDKQCRWNVIK